MRGRFFVVFLFVSLVFLVDDFLNPSQNTGTLVVRKKKCSMGFWQIYRCCCAARYLDDGGVQGIIRIPGKSEVSLDVAVSS